MALRCGKQRAYSTESLQGREAERLENGQLYADGYGSVSHSCETISLSYKGSASLQIKPQLDLELCDGARHVYRGIAIFHVQANEGLAATSNTLVLGCQDYTSWQAENASAAAWLSTSAVFLRSANYSIGHQKG